MLRIRVDEMSQWIKCLLYKSTRAWMSAPKFLKKKKIRRSGNPRARRQGRGPLQDLLASHSQLETMSQKIEVESNRERCQH